MSTPFLSLDLKKLVQDEIIDFLPGIFYVYQLVDQDFELIHWNTNHERVTGYSGSELQGKRVFDFFYPNDFEVIQNGLGAIMENGEVRQVQADLRLKNGQTLPYIFEGFRFHSDDGIYFLGVGIDISGYVSAQRELEKVRFELMQKDRELLGFSFQNAELMRVKQEFKENLDLLQSLGSVDEIKKKLLEFENKLKQERQHQEVWETFKLRFNRVHNDFFVNLQSRHPSLSKSEMMYLAYLKIKLSNFQISTLLNIGKEAIKKKRYRIRKKLGIRADLTLESYIERF